jgi:hypothetical protein
MNLVDLVYKNPFVLISRTFFRLSFGIVAIGSSVQLDLQWPWRAPKIPPKTPQLRFSQLLRGFPVAMFDDTGG